MGFTAQALRRAGAAGGRGSLALENSVEQAFNAEARSYAEVCAAPRLSASALKSRIADAAEKLTPPGRRVS